MAEGPASLSVGSSSESSVIGRKSEDEGIGRFAMFAGRGGGALGNCGTGQTFRHVILVKIVHFGNLLQLLTGKRPVEGESAVGQWGSPLTTGHGVTSLVNLVQLLTFARQKARRLGDSGALPSRPGMVL